MVHLSSASVSIDLSKAASPGKAAFCQEQFDSIIDKLKKSPNADIWTRAKVSFLSQRNSGPRFDFLDNSCQLSDQLVLAFKTGKNCFISAFSRLITDSDIPLHLFVKRDMAILLAASVTETELRDTSKSHRRITPYTTIGKIALDAIKLLKQADQTDSKGPPFANVTQLSNVRTYRRMVALGIEKPKEILRTIAEGKHPLYTSTNAITLAGSRDSGSIF